MYWQAVALTRMGLIVNRTLKGSRAEALAQLKLNELDPISIHPDFKKYFVHHFLKGSLSGGVLSSLFKDLSRGLKSGLSIRESIDSLYEQSVDPLLKATLGQLSSLIIDGYSFKEAFEQTKVFPSIVMSTLDAAQRSGNLAQVSMILSEYFRFMEDKSIALIKSLIYPLAVFIALTAASIVISVELVPQLSLIMPTGHHESFSARFIVGYAGFIQSYWWVLVLVLICGVVLIIKAWGRYKDSLMSYVFHLPLMGKLIKEMELTQLFLNLYVYQKSGVNIITSLNNIYTNHPNAFTQRLIGVKNRVNQGSSLGEALKLDGFFPSFIYSNVMKGETTGNMCQYFYEIYQYYDQKSRDSIETLINFINPALLTVAVVYLGMIISCFILPLYSSMSGGGMGFNQ